MERSARRDGTPGKKPQRSTSQRTSQGGGSDRSASKGGYPRGGQRANPAGASSGAAAGPSGKGGSGKGGSGKRKAPKPTKQARVLPTISNAKPAKHQNPQVANSQERLPWGEGVRLQKVLAAAGVASRRVAEEMIAQGRIEVDGQIVLEQGLRIDPKTAVVRVDGTRVVVQEDLVHFSLNKPRGWQSTMSDELGRPCVGDIVAERVAAGQRLFHVGRLDAETEGLLLLTNDGELAHRLMHPSYAVTKTYLATVEGVVAKETVRRLRDGVELDDGPAKADKVQVIEFGGGRSLVKVVLHEGRKHIVRRLLAAVGHPVSALVRTHIGDVALGNQRPGQVRALTREEVGKLYGLVGL